MEHPASLYIQGRLCAGGTGLTPDQCYDRTWAVTLLDQALARVREDKVREAGGGPTEQFIAAVLGGVATPFAVGAVTRGVKGGGNGVRSTIAPKDIQGRITVELQRAGIDWNALSRQAQVELVKDAQREGTAFRSSSVIRKF